MKAAATSKRSLDAFVAVFRDEYDRISRAVYNGRLPAFPGVTWGNDPNEYAYASWNGRKLSPFRVNRMFAQYAPERDMLIVIRHEIAHVGCRWFGRDDGHGPDWQRHAIMCGTPARERQPDIRLPQE